MQSSGPGQYSASNANALSPGLYNANTDVGKDIIGEAPLIPMRLIDSTMRREQPEYYRYLTQPDRQAVFVDVKAPQNPPSLVEAEFTRVCRYTGWVSPLWQTVDGAALHGWDAIEVELAPENPGFFRYRHIGADNLFVPVDVINYQTASSVLVRRYLSISELAQLKSLNDAVPAAIKELEDKFEATKESNGAQRLMEVFKVYYKHEGLVYFCWYSESATDYLVKPQPFYMGLQRDEETTKIQQVQAPDGSIIETPIPVVKTVRVQETEYPIHIFVYSETEEEQLTRHTGRAFADRSMQRAQSCLASAYINRELNSSDVYGAIDKTNVSTSNVKQLDTPLTAGAIYDNPLKFFSLPPGQISTINAIQYFGTMHASDAGQFEFAAANRKDTRKTAKEMEVAQNQQSGVASVNIGQFSTFLSLLLKYTWRIVQSFAARGKITFCALPDGSNDIAMISRVYQIKPAGDVDVVERQQKLTALISFLEILPPQTPVGQLLAQRALELAFPQENFTAKLNLVQELQAKLTAATALLQASLTPQEIASLPPDQQQQTLAVLGDLGILPAQQPNAPLNPAQQQQPVAGPVP